MSLPEALLWRELRKRPGGLKFRRQHPSGPYILDFYCSDARLAIEVDGETHARGDRPARDELRDAWFAEHGVVTLRVPASEVLRDIGDALEGVIVTAFEALPLHHPLRGRSPSPSELGED